MMFMKVLIAIITVLLSLRGVDDIFIRNGTVQNLGTDLQSAVHFIVTTFNFPTVESEIV